MNSARKTRGQIRLYLLIVRVVHQFWFISTAKNPEKLWAQRFLDDNRKSLKKVIPVVVSEAARLGKSSFECKLRCTESHYRVCFLQKSLSQHALPMCRLLPSFIRVRPTSRGLFGTTVIVFRLIPCTEFQNKHTLFEKKLKNADDADYCDIVNRDLVLLVFFDIDIFFI